MTETIKKDAFEAIQSQEDLIIWKENHRHLTAGKLTPLIKRAEKQIAKFEKQVLVFETMRGFDGDQGFDLGTVAGVDEAGRGPLAGPVVAAAVVMPKDSKILGIDDSKKLTEAQREALFDVITQSALSYGIGIVDHRDIDRINILEATKLAMAKAIDQVNALCVLVDAVKISADNKTIYSYIKGDEKSYAIAAASILAKVTRDRLMKTIHQTYPEYGFDVHKGYGTPKHYKALDIYGPSPVHRSTFLRKWCEARENK